MQIRKWSIVCKLIASIKLLFLLCKWLSDIKLLTGEFLKVGASAHGSNFRAGGEAGLWMEFVPSLLSIPLHRLSSRNQGLSGAQVCIPNTELIPEHI